MPPSHLATSFAHVDARGEEALVRASRLPAEAWPSTDGRASRHSDLRGGRQQKHRRMRAAVMSRVPGETPAVRRRFWQVLACFAVNRDILGFCGHRGGANQEKPAWTSRLCLQHGFQRKFAAVVDLLVSQVEAHLANNHRSVLSWATECTS